MAPFSGRSLSLSGSTFRVEVINAGGSIYRNPFDALKVPGVKGVHFCPMSLRIEYVPGTLNLWHVQPFGEGPNERLPDDTSGSDKRECSEWSRQWSPTFESDVGSPTDPRKDQLLHRVLQRGTPFSFGREKV